MHKILKKAQEFRKFSRELSKIIHELDEEGFGEKYFELRDFNTEDETKCPEIFRKRIIDSLAILRLKNIHQIFTNYRESRNYFDRQVFLKYNFDLEKNLIREYRELKRE